jgi:hypothetical protein
MRKRETWRDSAYSLDRDEEDDGEFQRGLVFVGMAFDLPADKSDVFQAVKHTCGELGLRATRVDDRYDSGPIPVQVLKTIEDAEFLVFDLSTERPNVYYELGYAHGIGNRSEEIVLIARSGSKLHFDIAQLRILFYDSAIDLSQKLASMLQRMIEATRK